VVPHDFIFPDQLVLRLNGQADEVHPIPYFGLGYVHEIEEVHQCLRDGTTQSDLHPLSTERQDASDDASP
jgi:hypothetical protein